MIEKSEQKPEKPVKEPGEQQAVETGEYYRRLKSRLRVAFLIAFLVPLAILSIYFHLQFNLNLKESGKVHLTILAESQRNTIEKQFYNAFRPRQTDGEVNPSYKPVAGAVDDIVKT